MRDHQARLRVLSRAALAPDQDQAFADRRLRQWSIRALAEPGQRGYYNSEEPSLLSFFSPPGERSDQAWAASGEDFHPHLHRCYGSRRPGRSLQLFAGLIKPCRDHRWRVVAPRYPRDKPPVTALEFQARSLEQ